MTNLVTRNPIINDIKTLVQSAGLNASGTTGSTLDLQNANDPDAIVVTIAGTLTEVNTAFVRIEESDEGTVWFPILTLNGIKAAGVTQTPIKRTKRRIRAVVVVETPSNPTAPSIPLTVLLIL